MSHKLTKGRINEILGYFYPLDEIFWRSGNGTRHDGFFGGTVESSCIAKTPGPKVTIWTTYPQWKMALREDPLNKDETESYLEVYRVFVIGRHALDSYPVSDKAKNAIEVLGIEPYESLVNKGNYHNIHKELDIKNFNALDIGHGIRSVELVEKQIMGDDFYTQTDEEIEHLRSENEWKETMKMNRHHGD